MTQYNPKPQAAKSSSKLLWILLSIFGGGFLLCCGVCGGAALWFSRFPAVGEEAREPFEYASVPIPSFEKGEFIEVDEVPETYQVRQIILGDGTGYGNVPGLNGVLWHYGPKEIAKGTKLPCVLIAPAGSTLLTGMELGDGDATEHIPYLKAGFAVIAYSLDGPSLSNPPDIPAYEAYSQARGGLVNARNALEYAIQQPEIDPKRIFVAGHSSAGTVALLFASHEKRLAGCVAYAPCSDFQARLPVPFVRALGSQLPKLPEFIVQTSPRTHETRMQCPVMVFHAADDSNVPVTESREYVARLTAAGKDVTFVEVPTGNTINR